MIRPFQIPYTDLWDQIEKTFFLVKWRKRGDKQLALAHTTESQKALSKLPIDLELLQQKVCFLGQLFIPYGVSTPSIGSLNPECIVGFWIRFVDFNSTAFQSYQFYITHKHEWLHEPNLDVLWKCHLDILMDIKVKHKNLWAPLLWIKKEGNLIEKGFVVWW